MNNLTPQTLAALQDAVSKGNNDAILKAFSQATGLINYDLQPVARIIYPVITPIRNMMPRVAGNGGTATNWRAITAINLTGVSAGVTEGERGGVISTQVKSYMASYKTLGLEDYVTFEAELAAVGFDDAKARAVEGLLRSLMIAEEKVMLGGNTSLQLGTTPTPTLAEGVTGSGAISSGVDVVVTAVALTFEGYGNASLTGGILQAVTRTNADGTTSIYGGGSAQPSAAATLTTTVANSSVQASVSAVKGAVAYAWYWGATAGSAQKLGAITTINSLLITTAAGAYTQNVGALTASDNSTNGLVYDGLLYIAFGAGQENPAAASSGALVSVQPTGTPGVGTPLTADGAGGIVEIDADLKSFWDNFRLGPTHIFVGSQELSSITKKLIAGGGAPLFRFNIDGAGQTVADGTIRGGQVVGSYLNKYTMAGGELIKVQLHPNMPAGTIMYYTDRLPYPLSNISNVNQVKTRRDYYQIEYPIRTRKYEYGVYVDSVLQSYFPPSLGVRTNIAQG